MTAIERMPAPTGSHSDAVAVHGEGRWVYVTGQLGLTPEGAPVAGGLAAEARAALDAIERVLARAGGRMSDVVKLTTYVTSFDGYDGLVAARAERFGDAPPASATVQVAGLFLGATVEIEAVAFVAS